ncbi:hypothetical protein [Nitrosococcus wardiae]|uniref:EF-hand domain-containing protein n=1 Tax=Nitrosococcus wardiae TaxID=1814290 RepID=A0A4P7BYU4_9GAMM|nr:hypothetical protein [Nitrosococcus wardiae]QBQ54354.1 hypothetical protein E3U44_07400 [Nitrosococcus wardiae]
MKKLGCYLGFFAALAVGLVHADFLDWNTNQDGVVNEIEYKYGFEADGVFEKWGSHSDGFVDGDEFGSRLYNISDADNDDRLRVSALGDAIDGTFSKEGASLSMGRLNPHGDDTISPDAFGQIANNTGLYPLLDHRKDHVIEPHELENSLFKIAKGDGRGALDKDAFLCNLIPSFLVLD